MRKVREVLRLKYACGASERVIARSVGIGRTAIGEYIRRAAVIGITSPIPEELDDTALERKLFAPAGYNPPRRSPTARGSSNASQYAMEDVAFSSAVRDRHLGIRPVSQLNTWPMVSPVNASRLPSRAEPRASLGVGVVG
jgi:hypothetical protein